MMNLHSARLSKCTKVRKHDKEFWGDFLVALQMFRLLWLYAALYDLTGIGARGPKYPFPEAWRLGLGQIALASPFAVVGGGSETTGNRLDCKCKTNAA